MCFWFKGQTCRHAQILDTVLAHTLWKLLFLQQRNGQEWDIYTSNDISTDRHRSVPKYTSFTCTRCLHRTLPHLNLKSFHCKFISLIKEDDEQWEEDYCRRNDLHHVYSLSGLTLEIDIEQDQYISQLSQESGVRVSIGGQEEMPFPYEQGISASPGYSTAIQLRKVRY